MIRALAHALLLAFFIITPETQAEVPVPPLAARVTDLTGTLDAAQTRALESRLAQFETQKGSQIAVLIIPTTQPETIEQYGIRVADAWKLGRKGIDDGALLLIAKNDRTLRIEVGYGLEGALNDATAKRIVSEIIEPKFKQGDFYGGIAAGVDRMTRVIEGEALPASQGHGTDSENSINSNSLLFFGFVMVTVVGGMLRVLFGRLAAATMTGLIIGLLAWFLATSLLLAMVGAGAAFFLTLVGGGRGYLGGFGGLGGGLSGGGGFGGSGGGGGGGFGGGGASGRW